MDKTTEEYLQGWKRHLLNDLSFLKRETIKSRQDLIRVSRKIQKEYEKRHKTDPISMVYEYPLWGMAEIYLAWCGERTWRIRKQEIDYIYHHGGAIIGRKFVGSCHIEIDFMHFCEVYDPDFFDDFECDRLGCGPSGA